MQTTKTINGYEVRQVEGLDFFYQFFYLNTLIGTIDVNRRVSFSPSANLGTEDLQDIILLVKHLNEATK
jgi:hypothetical protein